jgi:uncharacterized protein HemX
MAEMNTSLYFWLAAALLVVMVGGAVWWRLRQRLALLKDQLREAQDSRLELFDETQTLRRQLHASVKAPSSARVAASVALAEAAQRRAALELALDATAPAASGGWQDTMPMAQSGVSGNERSAFQPTQPAPLSTRQTEPTGP